jgi:hypothetical protein
MSGSWSFCGSLMIPVTTLRIVIFAERQAQILLAKPNLLTRTFVTILAYTSFDVASDRPASRSVDLTGLFLAKEFVCMFSFLLIVVTSKH